MDELDEKEGYLPSSIVIIWIVGIALWVLSASVDCNTQVKGETNDKTNRTEINR